MVVSGLIVSPSLEGCSPKCSGGDVCVTAGCKGANEGSGSCSVATDCADSTNGVCSSGVCWCKSGYMWSYYFNQCLHANDGSYCNTIADCADQGVKAGCDSHQCVCYSSCRWTSVDTKCCTKNDGGSCSYDNRCYDYTNGHCDDNDGCVCNSNYVWDSVRMICMGLNNGGSSCEALMQCQDRSNRALCTGACTCQSDCVYSSTYQNCRAPCISGAYTCGSSNDCISTTNGGCNGGYCSCNSGYYRKSSACVGYNDGTKYCPGLGNCWDQRSDRAACTGSRCVCANGAVWNSAAFLCLWPNSWTYSCSSLSECYDYSSAGACSTTCGCATGYYWSSVQMRCLAGNTGSLSCSATTDCWDQTAGICSGGACVCKTYNVWDSGLAYCRCVPGTCSATGRNDCALCGQGTYQSATGATGCTSCSAGTYNSNQGSTGVSACLDCDVGTWSAAGAASCTDCSAGKYTNVKRTTTCQDCGLGTYQPDTGKTGCIDCSAGKYQDVAGQGTCKDCPLGTYNGATGQPGCTICPCGTYGPTTGLTECNKCGTGTHNSGTNKQSPADCQACAANTYGPDLGRCACISCPMRSTSAVGAVICTCDVGAYYNASEPVEYCPPCYDLCAACYGDKHSCSACATNAVLVTTGEGCHCPVEDGFYLYFNTIAQKLECHPCHRLCLTCSGPTRDECLTCRPGITHLADISGTTCNCLDGYFDDSTKLTLTTYCQPCYRYCTHCDVTYDNCQTCIDNLGVTFNNPTCACNTPGYFEYYNTTLNDLTCVTCDPRCATCYGPTNTECYTCATSVGAIRTGTDTCDCVSRYFYDTALAHCEACSSLCTACFGYGSDQCYSCDTTVAYSFEGNANLCITDCYSYSGRFVLGTECKGTFWL